MAGYVASKMDDIKPSLSCTTTEASDALTNSVPSSWLTTISRGGLHLPQPWWMAVVENFEANFKTIMGPVFCREPGIMRRLVAVIGAHHPAVDPRVARRLAHVRLQLRIRWLRRIRQDNTSDARREARQVRQYIASNRWRVRSRAR